MKKTIKTFNENNELHSFDDEPAIILSDGSRSWYENGWLHRYGDKPAMVFADGTEEYYIDGEQYLPVKMNYPEPPLVDPKEVNCYNKKCSNFYEGAVFNCKMVANTKYCKGFYGEKH